VHSNLHAIVTRFYDGCGPEERAYRLTTVTTHGARAAHSSTLGVSSVASSATECQQNWKLSGFDSSETRQAAHL